MKAIEIDFEVHQKIELERVGFDEPENDALRRLLGLGKRSRTDKQPKVFDRSKPFREDGVVVPNGSEARMYYQRKSQYYQGRFEDGYLVVDGQKFSALSTAASTLAKTKDGKSPSLNGWLYWEVKFPSSAKWIKMSELREKS